MIISGTRGSIVLAVLAAVVAARLVIVTGEYQLFSTVVGGAVIAVAALVFLEAIRRTRVKGQLHFAGVRVVAEANPSQDGSFWTIRAQYQIMLLSTAALPIVYHIRNVYTGLAHQNIEQSRIVFSRVVIGQGREAVYNLPVVSISHPIPKALDAPVKIGGRLNFDFAYGTDLMARTLGHHLVGRINIELSLSPDGSVSYTWEQIR